MSETTNTPTNAPADTSDAIKCINNVKNKKNIIDDIKNFKFYKWCNCERTISKIIVKCYDYPLEAIAEYEKETEKYESNNNYKRKETMLLPIFKYMPEFIQKNSIQNKFKRPIQFDFANLSYKLEDDKS